MSFYNGNNIYKQYLKNHTTIKNQLEDSFENIDQLEEILVMLHVLISWKMWEWVTQFWSWGGANDVFWNNK